MDIPRLDPTRSALLVVDVQERLLPTIVRGEALAEGCAVLLEAADALGLPALVTEQYPRGLGPTVPAVARSIGRGTPVIEKTRFSALVPAVQARLEDGGISTVLVCGIEAHICVLQTVLDLQAQGRRAFVVTDAVSAAQEHQIAPAYHRMLQAGAVLTGVLSAIYELLGSKDHPSFGRCLALAKRASAAG